jgi:hypothetical protein
LRNLAARKIAPAAMWWGLNCKQSDVRSLHSSSNSLTPMLKGMRHREKTQRRYNISFGPLFAFAKDTNAASHPSCTSTKTCKRIRAKVRQLHCIQPLFDLKKWQIHEANDNWQCSTRHCLLRSCTEQPHQKLLKSTSLPIIHKIPCDLCKCICSHLKLFNGCYQWLVGMMNVKIKAQCGQHQPFSQ